MNRGMIGAPVHLFGAGCDVAHVQQSREAVVVKVLEATVLKLEPGDYLWVKVPGATYEDLAHLREAFAYDFPELATRVMFTDGTPELTVVKP